MESLIVSLQHLIIPLLIHPALSKLIRSTIYIWLICQVLHFIGVGVLIGVVGFAALRLMG